MAKITVYSTPTCVYCKMAKAYFDEKGIAYEDKDVTTDIDAQKAMIEKSGQMGVPVIDIDGQIVVGFDKPRIVSFLGIE